MDRGPPLLLLLPGDSDESADEWEVFNIATAFNRLQPDPTQRFSAAFASASVALFCRQNFA